MAESIPDCLVLKRHRDFEERKLEEWMPRIGLALYCLIPLLALFNVFGQKPKVEKVANPNGVATLELSAPTQLRGGLLFQARFDIKANKDIKDAVLVLDSGWAESMTINTIEPAAAEETSRDGSLAFDIGQIPQGKTWRQYMQFQVNPVNAGSQSQGVTLYDGNVPLLHMNRNVRVWP